MQYFNLSLIHILMNHQFKEVARILNIKMIHVNDIDLQKIVESNDKNCLYNTWCEMCIRDSM